jgi:KaiC/GvpD/RAD55 family RecA-like ATPase
MFGFSTLTGCYDNKPRFQRSTFDGLFEHLQSHTRVIPLTMGDYLALDDNGQKNHKSGPAVCLTEFNGTRSIDNVVRTFGLGLDVDEAHVERDRLVSLLSGTSAIIYESANSVPSARRWRVFIEYARPFTPEEHAAAFEHWRAIIPGASDKSKDAARLWYCVQRFKDSDQRMLERLPGRPYIAQAPRRVTPQEAFRRHIKPPADTPASVGSRNDTMLRYLASKVSECESEEELLEVALEKNDEYERPLPKREVSGMVRRTWKRREKLGWKPLSVIEEETSEDEEKPGLPFMPVEFTTPAPKLPTPVVAHWLPRRVVTLFSAHGGTGKSYVALEVAVRVCLGLPVFGCQADSTPVLFYSCEDEEAVLRARADRFAEHFGYKPADLDGRLFLYDVTAVGDGDGFDVEWYKRFDSTRSYGPTRTMEMVYNTAEAFGCGAVIADNVSDIFAGEENNRAQVRGFMRLVKNQTQRVNAATLLLGHTNKPSASAKAGEDVQGYSGSTAWHNSARSRWWMARAEDDRERLELSLEKSNYGKSGLLVEVRWNEEKGVLLSQDAQVHQALGDLRMTILAKLAEYEDRGIELLASARAGGAAQSALRKDIPSMRRFKATAVQDELEAMYREGLLAKGSREARNTKAGGKVALFTVTDKGREALEASNRRVAKLRPEGG